MKKSCKTCKYADFQRTPSDRIRTNKCGKCTYAIPVQVLPICVPQPNFLRSSIWTDMGDDCPVYEVRL